MNMGEKEKEAQKTKKALYSKEVEDLLKKSEEILCEKPIDVRQFKTEESKEDLEKLKRKKQRLEQAL